MQYSRQKIEFLSGDIEVKYDFIPSDEIVGEHKIMIDVIRHYSNGDKRLARFHAVDFIEELYYFSRYQMDQQKGSYKKYKLALDSRYRLVSEIRDIEKEIIKSGYKIKKPDFEYLKEELNTVIDSYKVTYDNLWWRVKLPIIVSLIAIALSVFTALDKYVGIFKPAQTTERADRYTQTAFDK